jgi:hypothetical protein
MPKYQEGDTLKLRNEYLYRVTKVYNFSDQYAYGLEKVPFDSPVNGLLSNTACLSEEKLFDLLAVKVEI